MSIDRTRRDALEILPYAAFPETKERHIPSPMAALDSYVLSRPLTVGCKHGATTRPSDLPLSILVTEDEKAWLTTHPLQPIATFDGSGTAQIKIYAPDITAEQFLDNLVPYQTYKYSTNVETCFNFDAAGSDGRTEHYQFTAVRNHGFFPTITRVHRDDNVIDDGKVGVSWELVPQEEALSLIATGTFRDKLGETLVDAKMNVPLDNYMADIENNLGQISAVEGRQEFDQNTRIHTYVQHVELSGWFSRTVSNAFGSGAIIGAALKVAYHVLGQPEYAGTKGSYGKEVEAMGGIRYQPGP
jgi:hypothetical protein